MRDLRQACVTPHVAQKSRHSAIDGRTTRNEGYALSQKHRKRIKEPFGWGKTGGGLAPIVYRGIERVRSRFVLIMAASNFARLPLPLGRVRQREAGARRPQPRPQGTATPTHRDWEPVVVGYAPPRHLLLIRCSENWRPGDYATPAKSVEMAQLSRLQPLGVIML